MRYNFDEPIERRGTASSKWDGLKDRYGVADAIPMWVADMDFKSPPEVVEALRRRVEHGVFGYTVRPDSYLEAIAGWQKARHGWSVDPAWICHAPGVVPAIGFLIDALTEPGDRVIVQPPVYYPFYRLLRQRDRQIVYNPLRCVNGRYEMDYDDLEARLAEGAKMLLLCSPHNPVGRVWSADELRRLGALCQRYGVLVVADEIHGDLVYRPHVHTPYASLGEAFAAQSVTCVAPSKTFNLAGLHTASVIIPNPELRRRYQEVIARAAVGSVNVFGLTATEAAYREGGPWLEALLSYLEGNLDLLTSFVAERMPELKVIRPEGTYLAWIDCRGLGISDPQALQAFWLREAKVAFDQGYIFGPGGEGFVRINVGCPRVQLKACLERMADAVERHRAAGRA
ncbi:MalY/PatB family protein [Alicyclobacillus macrosporangiidus]|uniref:cysteine-S-conjugate beta-lyase n=1 Tax=Alicyclobacillus macrosporangiidus TaxID=392015 RepID=A0A1I7GSM9_9BACL|nr:MalY/PatB family protein [Alicyclobacillus macrosporangiidus]SFU51463.1 cystathione beta-lyase [Alicyclobacillus macrosporangiidus]